MKTLLHQGFKLKSHSEILLCLKGDNYSFWSELRQTAQY